MAIGENFKEILNIYSQYNSWSEFVSAHPELASQFEAADFDQLVLSGVFNGWTEIVNLNNGAQGIVQGTAALQGALQPTTTYIYDAAQAIDQYVEANGNPTGGALPVWAAAAGFIPGIGKLSLAGLLGIAANVVCCGAAAGIGLKIGTDIYETNPDFWQECYEAAYPWLFKGIDKAIGIDYGGRTYIDARLYEAMRAKILELVGTSPSIKGLNYEAGELRVSGTNKEVTVTFGPAEVEGVPEGGSEFTTIGFQSFSATLPADSRRSYAIMGIKDSDGAISPLRVAYSSINTSPVVTSTLTFTYASGVGISPIVTTGTPWIDGGSVSVEGRTIFILYLPGGQQQPPSATGYNRVRNKDIISWGGSPVFNSVAEALEYIKSKAYDALYNYTEIEYPEGVSEWEGDTVDNPYDGAIDALILPDPPTYTPYVPIALPEWGVPALNPITNPNPQEYTNPAEQVRPYSLPLQQPEGNPIPNVDSDSDPAQNPSSQPETAPSSSTPSTSYFPDAGQSPTNIPNVTPPVFEPGSSDPSGLINVYNPTPQELYAFGRWLWVTYTDITIEKILNNPFDGVISLHEIYATPNRGARQVIRSGFLSSPADALTVPNRYSYINCGSIVVPEWYGNYLDYSPYTKVFVYLPFIGIEEIDADDVIGAAINVTYGVDSYSGACVAIITTAREGYNSTTYQFTGNCAVEHPVTGGTQAQNLIAMLQGTIGVATSFFTSNFNGMVSSAFDFTKSKSTVSHSGKFGANFGAMACKKPYLIVKRPNQVVVPNYNEFYGYPAHKYVVIGSCTGYLRCKEVHVNSARATDEEKARIEELLKAGVYVS